jgi:catechol 2,3-dioxygenase-like lactoylglutathione lyase family enzyme
MLKQISSLLFYSGDFNRSADFYKKLGFQVERTQDAAKVRLGNFEMSFIDKNLAIIQKEAHAEPKGLGMFIYIEVDDLDSYFDLLKKKGVGTLSEPKDWPWGNREFVVKDPDGYKLIFFKKLK